MSECDTILNEINPWIYKTPRDKDFFLMDVVMRSDLPDTHKEIFNRVRINMELLTASDIVVANSSTKIIPHIYNGNHCRNSNLKWPVKQVLPQKWHVIFNDTIRSIIKQQLESTPLGKWHSDGHQSFQYGVNE